MADPDRAIGTASPILIDRSRLSRPSVISAVDISGRDKPRLPHYQRVTDMPRTVRLSIWLFATSILISLFSNGYFSPPNSSDSIGLYVTAKIFFLSLAAPVIAFLGFLLYKVSKRRTWARYALLAFVAFIVWREASSLFAVLALIAPLTSISSLTGLAMLIAPGVLQLVSIGLLFTPAASRWFAVADADSPQASGISASRPSATPGSAAYRPIAVGVLVSGLVIGAVIIVSHIAARAVVGASGGSSDDVKPGDASYPSQNSHPSHVVQLIVSGADATDMRFVAGYSSDAKLCSHRIPVAGIDAPYSMSVPISMTAAADGYRGSIVIDKYTPGSCGWHFDGVGYGMVGGVQNVLADLRGNDASLGSTMPPREFWCYRVTYEQKPVHDCEELVMLRWSNAIRAVSREFVAQFPPEQQDYSRVLHIGESTSEVRVTLHDLNAIEGALIPVGDRQTQTERADADHAMLVQTPEYKAIVCFQDANFKYGQTHRPLPDANTQAADIAAMKAKCRTDLGLAPTEPQ